MFTYTYIMWKLETKSDRKHDKLLFLTSHINYGVCDYDVVSTSRPIIVAVTNCCYCYYSFY